MEKILIMGGAGFIGSKLCEVLVRENYDVAIIDNFIQYSDPLAVNYSVSLEYRKKFLKNVKVYRADASISYELQKCLSDFKPDRIVHLAALTRADINDDSMLGAVNKSLMPLLTVMEYYRDKPNELKRFLYVSSSYAYGNFQHSPCDEEHPKVPTSTYGGVKLSCEVLTSAWGKRFSIPYTIVRPIACYGPSDLNGKLSMQNIKRVIDKKELYIMSSLDELSDYTYVDDLAEGMKLALFNPNAEGEIFNLSSGKGLKLSEIIEHFNNLGYEVKPVMAPVLKSRPKRGYLCIDKARKVLGYNPKVDIEEGLKRCIDYINSHKIIVEEEAQND